MVFFRQSWLKRLWSEQLATNNSQVPDIQVPSIVQPTISIEPELNILRSATSATTLYTTPSDKDFYLTSISLSGSSNASATVTLTVTTFDNASRTINLQVSNGGVLNDSVNNSLNMIFPMRGLKLARNSTVALSFNSSTASANIAGYTAGDR